MESGSERLVGAIAAIKKLVDSGVVGKRILPEVQEIITELEPIAARIAEIEDMYALDFGKDIDGKISAAAALWQAAAPGTIKGNDLLAIRRASPLLSELHLKGLNIQRAYKFTAIEDELAEWFGTRIDKLSDFLQALRRERASDKAPGEWLIFVRLSLALRDALNFLAERKLLQGKRVLMKLRDGGWTAFDWDRFRDDPKTQLMVVYEKKNPPLLSFLHGHWLNTYVYGIINDQLLRHEVAYELYTEVVYKAPADVIHSASDFDVIGRFRDTVICVECKGGKLDEKHGQITDIVRRTQDLRTVLSSMGTGETKFLFFVVYDPEMNSSDEIATKLSKNDIQALRPNEVRSVIARTLDASLR